MYSRVKILVRRFECLILNVAFVRDCASNVYMYARIQKKKALINTSNVYMYARLQKRKHS